MKLVLAVAGLGMMACSTTVEPAPLAYYVGTPTPTYEGMAVSLHPSSSTARELWDSRPRPTPTPTPEIKESTPEPYSPPAPTRAEVRQSAPAGAYSEADMDALLEAVGWPPATRERAKAIAWCESNWRPWVISRTNDYGLWQINGIHHDATLDPWGNARAAMRISSGGQDWSAWSCS